MTQSVLYDLVKVFSNTVGTGTLTVQAALQGFLDFNTGGINSGDNVSYTVFDGPAPASGQITDTETGQGVAAFVGGNWTITRHVRKSTNNNTAINCSGNQIVALTLAAEDIQGLMFFPLAGGTITGNTFITNSAHLIIGDTLTDQGSLFELHQSVVHPVNNLTPMFQSVVNVVSGSAPGAFVPINSMTVSGDVSTTGTNALLALSYTFGGPLFTGQAVGLNVGINMTAASAPRNDQVFYIAGNFGANASANAGGTDTIFNPLGQLYSINVFGTLKAGATNFEELTPAEIDSIALLGSSVSRRTNLKLHLNGFHAVQGSVEDNMLSFSRSKDSTVGTVYAISVGSVSGFFPNDNTTGVFIGYRNVGPGHTPRTGVNPQLDRFIDATGINALTAHWKSPGTIIDPAGNHIIGPAKISWSSQGLSIDVFGQVGGTPTVVDGGTFFGSGAVDGQIVSTGNNDIYSTTEVLAVLGTMTPIVPASIYGNGPTDNQTVLIDGCNDATCTIPWTNARSLMLQTSGGPMSFFGVTPVVRQTATDLPSVITALQAYGLLH